MPVVAIGCVTMDDPILRQLLLEAVYADYDDDDDGSALAALDEYLEQMSSPRFAKLHGYACPYCGSVCVDYVNDLALEGHIFRHDCACHMCDSDWRESYDMTGYLSSDGF